MLTQEEDVDANALHRRGWPISKIAAHLGRDPKTIRAYVRGERTAGVRKAAGDDQFVEYVEYVRSRLTEDPHLWAQTLFDELQGLGFAQSYQTLTRQIRDRGLRPHCEPCSVAKGRPVAVIEHPPGVETQWDWLELPDPPTSWGWGASASLFVGALAHSGKWRGQLCESQDQPHVIDALHKITVGLGGLTNVWRFDRMATVCYPPTGKVTASFAAVAKHYGVSVAICPARHGNRKGVVEKANHTAAQGWWRNLTDDVTVAQAQASLDRFCERRSDQRVRTIGTTRATVGEHAVAERLRPVTFGAYPAVLRVDRQVSAQALVAFRGNFYSVPPEQAHTQVVVSLRLDAKHIDIATRSGIIVARHKLAVAGGGVMIREHQHVTALDQAAMHAFDQRVAHRRKERIPPGPAARAAADQLLGRGHNDTSTVVDLSAYVEAANNRKQLP